MRKYLVAFDCGNSSYRTVTGVYDGDAIISKTVLQEEHESVEVCGLLYWDILRIYDGLIRGIKAALKEIPKIDSIGICTWGLDFALFKKGILISNPLSYRNDLGEKVLNKLGKMEQKKFFFETGILSDKINSVYTLTGMKEVMPDIVDLADSILMIPDILNYMLTGKMINEPSELSTTQLMNVAETKISKNICASMGIKETFFPEIGKHGNVIGNITNDVKKHLGIDYDIPVICVPSHDTASAVLAVAAEDDEEFAFISSGTWSLIGTEVDRPIINEDVLINEFTNEIGAFGKITLLKNSAGMYIIQRVRKELQDEIGKGITWDEMVRMARSCKNVNAKFDVNASCFFNPVNMSKTIYDNLVETGQVETVFKWELIIRSVYNSMAESYAATINNLQKVVSKTYKKIYIVGGGAQNAFLNEITAKRTGKQVVACSKEATALGCLVSQIKLDKTDDAYKMIRRVVRNSTNIKMFE